MCIRDRSIAFDFENGSGTYTYQGKIAGSFVSADTYLVIPEGVYRSMNPRGTAYGYLWVDCDKKDVASVEQSLNTLISNTSHIKMDTYHAQSVSYTHLVYIKNIRGLGYIWNQEVRQ